MVKVLIPTEQNVPIPTQQQEAMSQKVLVSIMSAQLSVPPCFLGALIIALLVTATLVARLQISMHNIVQNQT